MFIVSSALSSGGVAFEKYARWPAGGVFITGANQLIGTYSDLRRFQQFDRNYFGWHAHHIVESQDLDRLGVSHLFPPRDQQICVLLPERAHIGRINSVLRNQNPTNVRATTNELLRAYQDAYALVGDYSGGGEANIRKELMAIVSVIFRMAGLH